MTTPSNPDDPYNALMGGLTGAYTGGLFGSGPSPQSPSPPLNALLLPAPVPPPTYHLLNSFLAVIESLPYPSAVSARYMILVHAYPHMLKSRNISEEIDFKNVPPAFSGNKFLKAFAVRTLHKGGLFEPFLVHALAATVVFGFLNPDGSPGDELLHDKLLPFTDWDNLFRAWGQRT